LILLVAIAQVGVILKRRDQAGWMVRFLISMNFSLQPQSPLLHTTRMSTFRTMDSSLDLGRSVDFSTKCKWDYQFTFLCLGLTFLISMRRMVITLSLLQINRFTTHLLPCGNKNLKLRNRKLKETIISNL
jgi:hypothetical protein